MNPASRDASPLNRSFRLARNLSRAFAFAGLASFGMASAQTIPLAVVSTSKTLVSINGNAGHVAGNSAGDGFYVSQTDNTAYWLPRGSTHPIALITGLSGGRSIYVDSSNNVYVPSNYSGVIIEVPYVNGTYATGAALSSLSGTPCPSVTPTSPCAQFGSGGSVTSYYYQPTDLGFDASGNAYVIDEYSNPNPAGPGKANSILKWTPGTSGYTASYISQFLPQNNSAQIAVGPKGDVYYADGSNVYYIAAGTTKAVSITTSAMTDPTGVSTDQYGDAFITNANVPYAILEMPAVNGVAQQNSIFTFSQGYSANGIGFDGLGDYFYTGYSGGTNLNEARLYSYNLGSAAVGTPVSVTSATISMLFTAQVTPATITLTGGGLGFSYTPGTCAAGTTYYSGSSCNINVNFTPTAVGLQQGAVVLADSTGASQVTVLLAGVGLGAAQTSDPGTLSSIGGTLKTPQSIALDSANNVYIADPAQNAVLKYAPGSTTGTSIGTGLSAPTSVALDGAGNVYIGDGGNGRVVEVPNKNGTLTNSAQSVLVKSYTGLVTGTNTTGSYNLGSTLGVTADLYGNLYVADTNNAQVIRLATVDGMPNAGEISLVKVLTSAGATAFTAPLAVTTDNIGNLFIADTTANTITEVAYYGKGVLNLGSGYSHPSGLAADPSGSLYVADTGNSRVVKIPYESPIFNTNDQYLVGSTIAAPYGVALDASSNLYVVDSKDSAAYFLNRLQGTLPLGRANLNQPTSTLNGYVGSAGNQTLKLGTPEYVASGSTSVFTVSSPSSEGCANGLSIAAGFSCTLQASFDPTTTGNFSELLSFTSNALNTPTPSLNLTGVGLNLSPTTLTLTQQGSASFGQAVVITATINSTKSGTPTGSISFTVDGGAAGTYTVNGTSLQVSLSGLTGGLHTIGASYTGDNNFAPSNMTIQVTVAKVGTSTSVVAVTSTVVFQNPASAQPGTAIQFVATVTPSASTVPTGTVTFSYGTTVLGTAPVLPGSGGYIATFTTAALPAGNNTLIATYNGDVNYNPSSSSLLVVISSMLYTLTPSTASVTVGRAGTGVANFQVTSYAGYNGYVGLSCAGLPANTTCGFSPNGFILQASNLITAPTKDPTGKIILVPATYGPTQVVLDIITGTTPVVPQPPVGSLHFPGMGGTIPYSLALLGIAPLTFFLRRRLIKNFRRSTSLFTLFLALCGSVSLFSGCGSNLVGYTPPGNYTITITATSVAAAYTGTLAPGCSVTAPTATAATPTCTQTATVNLTVQ